MHHSQVAKFSNIPKSGSAFYESRTRFLHRRSIGFLPPAYVYIDIYQVQRRVTSARSFYGPPRVCKLSLSFFRRYIHCAWAWPVAAVNQIQKPSSKNSSAPGPSRTRRRLSVLHGYSQTINNYQDTMRAWRSSSRSSSRTR